MSARVYLQATTTAGVRLCALAKSGAMRAGLLVPVAAGLLLVVPSIVWLSLDRSVWPWDPAWYGQVSTELWAGLRLRPGAWVGLMAHAFGAKPPAIAWLGQFFVPLGSWFGGISSALLLSVVLCQAVTLGLVFATGRRLGGTLVGAVAALTAASAPLTVSMSHEYLVEPLQGLAVAWLLYVMVAARRRRIMLTLAQLGGAVALGLLVKLSSPFYMAFPAIATLIIAFHSRKEARDDVRPWWRVPSVLISLAFALLLSVGALKWYLVNWANARAHADTINSTLYGSAGSLTNKLSWWLPHFDQAIFLPLIDWVAAAAVGISLVIALRRRAMPDLVRSAAVFAPLGSVAVVLVLLALHPVNEIRYTMPLVPCIAVALASILSLGSWRPLLIVISLAFCVEFGLVTAQSFGTSYEARSYPLITAPSSPAFEQTLESVVRLTCPAAANDRISVIGDDLPFLNGNTMTYLAATTFDLKGRTCYYTPLGYAEQDPNAAWQRVLSFQPPFYITLDYAHNARGLPLQYSRLLSPSDPFNVVNKAVFDQVVHSSHFSVVPGSRHLGLVVFRGSWGG